VRAQRQLDGDERQQEWDPLQSGSGGGQRREAAGERGAPTKVKSVLQGAESRCSASPSRGVCLAGCTPVPSEGRAATTMATSASATSIPSTSLWSKPLDEAVAAR